MAIHLPAIFRKRASTIQLQRVAGNVESRRRSMRLRNSLRFVHGTKGDARSVKDKIRHVTVFIGWTVDVFYGEARKGRSIKGPGEKKEKIEEPVELICRS